MWCIEYKAVGRDLGGSGGGARGTLVARAAANVGHGARRGRVAPGEVASPKGRGRVGLASRPPVGTSVDPFARASFPGAHTWCAASRILGSFVLYYAAERGMAAGGAMGVRCISCRGCPWHLLQGVPLAFLQGVPLVSGGALGVPVYFYTRHPLTSPATARNQPVAPFMRSAPSRV